MAKTKQSEALQKKLFRSETNRIIAGVAGGLGEYFDIDPNIIRLIFIVLVFFSGFGILLYILLWILIPSQSEVGDIPEDHIKKNLNEIKGRAESFFSKVHKDKNHSDRRFWWGSIILLIGILFLLSNFRVFYFFDIFRLWPLILIIWGLSILVH